MYCFQTVLSFHSISSFDAQQSAANTAATSSNVEIEAAADAIIDFTEGNPFGGIA